MACSQKNKATAHHIGLLKAFLAKLRRELITSKGGGGSGPGKCFDVAKTGDAQIGFVSFPSVGKSTLLSNLTVVYSEVAAYEFTTLTTVPDVIRYKGAKIQLLYLPGIIEGAKDGKASFSQSERDSETEKSILPLHRDATTDELIDVVEWNWVYIPCIYVLNKIDQISMEELDIIYKVAHRVPMSAHYDRNFSNDLLEKI
ncbi:Developmentally-regulated GTP-binding protein 1 [Sciurus carolinensis]|uniref:Developmentally-regulated GTP-binding protein 1 n=1 Tax=Sciurus carolinensis TaxID=30640 RepID=A0AA41T1H7_SCICA|nr:Developmentally-regulated GTP-binding protein 1 [Sciurus carolinensis]